MSLAVLIAAQRAEHGIPHVVSCRALGVSPAWFYKWRDGGGSPRRQRRKALAANIGYLFHKHKQTYGSPRITADLRAMGWRVSKNTVAALMREQGLVARRTRRSRGTTKADKSARKAPDLLHRDFTRWRSIRAAFARAARAVDVSPAVSAAAARANWRSRTARSLLRAVPRARSRPARYHVGPARGIASYR